MTQIKDIFQKDINRDIRGVIKIGQDSEAIKKQELEEYVRAYRMKTLVDVTPPQCHLSVEKLRTTLLEKSQDWSYEREWRVIPRHINLENSSNLSYMKVRPKAVILGAQCERNNQKEIMDICDKKGIPVYKAEINYWQPGFRLAIIEPDRDD